MMLPFTHFQSVLFLSGLMQIVMVPDHLKKHVLGVVDANVLWYCALLIRILGIFYLQFAATYTRS